MRRPSLPVMVAQKTCELDLDLWRRCHPKYLQHHASVANASRCISGEPASHSDSDNDPARAIHAGHASLRAIINVRHRNLNPICLFPKLQTSNAVVAKADMRLALHYNHTPSFLEYT